MIITIDGPVASGKSTVARIMAQKLGYYYLYSGLLYRGLAYLLVHQCGYTLETITNSRVEDITLCFDPQKFSYHYDAVSQEHIFFDNRDITPYLKDSFIDNVSSIISVNEQVRKAVSTIQHAIAAQYNSVIEGRDVGSVVFPHAQLKFFLTASVMVRAERWRKDQEKYGNFVPLDEAMALITERDNRDKHRIIAPLIIPDGAIVVDSSDLNVEETVDTMMQHIR